MEQLTKLEAVLIKTYLIPAVTELENANKAMEGKEMDADMMMNFASNQGLISALNEILRKLG